MDLDKILRFFIPPSRNSHPLIVENRQHFRNFSKNLPLHDYEMVVLDTELTGLDSDKNEIIAMGGVRIRNMRICSNETFYALVKPDNQLHSASTVLHRITPQELLKARTLEDVLPEFIKFCGGAVLVGHYLRLDLEFINKAAVKLFGGPIRTPYLDTLRLAMAYNESKHGHYYDHYNISGAYTLSALAKEFNLPLFTEHNAIQDAMQTAYLFLFLAKKMSDHGFRTLHDFLHAGRNWKIL